MDTGKLAAELDKIQASINAIREMMGTTQPAPMGVAPVSPPKIKTAESVPAHELGPIPDYDSLNWPVAVAPSIIVDEANDGVKQYRALQIVDFLGIKSASDAVLDVGCGDGSVAAEIAMRAKFTVGFDVKKHPRWVELQTASLRFTDLRSVVESRSYDTILVYDTLDHLEGDDPTKFMKWLGSLLAKDGRIMVRTHPWTSAHGGHLYAKGKNKAFLHLALTADELAQRNLETPAGLRINRPLASYDNIFKNAGLVVTERKVKADPVDNFFSGALLDRIIKVTWKGNVDHDTALKIMTNSFIDYTLTLPGA